MVKTCIQQFSTEENYTNKQTNEKLQTTNSITENHFKGYGLPGLDEGWEEGGAKVDE